MDRLYNVGVYIRLSVEDSISDSDSIENQREMLSMFVEQMPGWIFHHCYVDNGFSGANFQRPAFQEMMTDVRCGKVNLVLVKDLSRFGRNYLEAGRYLEEELPALGCRFVALSDGIDTETGENDIMPFLNAMNDYYIKNLSDRIRSVLRAKALNGQKLSGSPYGFLRNPEDNTRLIVDASVAGIVRRIFALRKEGNGYPTIVKTLNQEGVVPPGIYSLERKGKDSSHIRTRCWIVTTVAMILKREAYIGTAEQFSTTVVSYRDKRQIKRSPEDRIRVENAYPAIIDRETWEAVQEINRCASEKCAHRSKAQKSLYSGLLVCADCGLTMSYWNPTKSYHNGQRIGYANFQCRTFQSTGGVACSKHTISESALKAILQGHIKQLAGQIALNENAMLDSLKNRLVGATALSQSEAKKETRRLERELHKLQAAIAKLYEDWTLEEVSEDHFTDSMKKYESERQEKEQQLALLKQSKEASTSKLADIGRWIQLIRENADVEDISRGLLESLVDKIEVGACGAEQAVRIYYKFVGLL